MSSISNNYNISSNIQRVENSLDYFWDFKKNCVNPLNSKELVSLYCELSDENKIEALFHIIVELREEELFIHLFSFSSITVQNAKVRVVDDLLDWAHFAGVCGALRVLRHLLESGFNMRTLTKKFADTPLSFAYEEGSIFSDPALLNALRKSDDGFSDNLFGLKIWGLRFSLSGSLFEGTGFDHQKAMYRSVLKTLHLAVDESSESVDKEIFTEVAQVVDSALHKTSTELRESLANSWVLLDTGYLGHATFHLFSSKICAKVDTESRENGGCKFYLITQGDISSIQGTMRMLSFFKRKKSPPTLAKDYWKFTKMNLGLTKFYHQYAFQTAGNCGWESLSVSILVLSMLIYSHKTGFSNDEQQALKNYNFWKRLDNEEALKGLVTYLKSMPIILYDKEKIIGEIMMNSLRIAVNRSDQWLICLLTKQYGYPDFFTKDLKNWQDRSSGMSLARAALLYNLSTVLLTLVHLGADFDTPDGEGKTIFDDIREDPAKSHELIRYLLVYVETRTSEEEKQRVLTLVNRLQNGG